LTVQYTNKIGTNYLDDEKRPAAKAKASSIEVLNPQASVRRSRRVGHPLG
jgi:hypothetical protein